MIKTQVRGILPVSLEVGYAYLRNLENMKDYNFSILSSRYLDKESKTSCRISVSLSVFSVEGLYKITEENEPYRFVAVLEEGNVKIQDTYEFKEVAEGTELTISDETSLKGILGWSEPLAHGFLKQGMEKNLSTLIQILKSLT